MILFLTMLGACLCPSPQLPDNQEHELLERDVGAFLEFRQEQIRTQLLSLDGDNLPDGITPGAYAGDLHVEGKHHPGLIRLSYLLSSLRTDLLQAESEFAQHTLGPHLPDSVIDKLRESLATSLDDFRAASPRLRPVLIEAQELMRTEKLEAEAVRMHIQRSTMALESVERDWCEQALEPLTGTARIRLMKFLIDYYAPSAVSIYDLHPDSDEKVERYIRAIEAMRQ